MAGQRVVITGASRGIGADMALAFAAQGAAVAISARNADDLRLLRERIEAQGGTAHDIPCDVADPVQVTAFAEQALEALGGVDVLVNNAGVANSHKFVDHPDELWHQMLAVNLTGVYYVTKALVKPMLAQKRGRILNIASIASKVGGRYIAAYTASKHGLLGLTRSLALELAPHITVNAICPAYVDSPMTDAAIANIIQRTGKSEAEAIAVLTEMSPQRRLIAPDEVTSLALYLALDTAHGITGQAINVDGGAVMW